MHGQQQIETVGEGPAMKILPGGRQPVIREELIKSLVDYIMELEEWMLGNGGGAERFCQQRLASAACMFAALEKEPSGRKLLGLLAAERRAYEYTLLPGPEGEEAVTAFAAFAVAAEKAVPEPAPRARNEKMTIKQEKKRFEVLFELFPPHDGHVASYQVFTTMGPTKAIVIATQNHLERKGDPIHRVASLKPLPGEEPQKQDLVDRLEF